MALYISFSFFIVFIGIISSEAILPLGVSLQRLAFYDPLQDFTCLDGSLTVPFTYVNDDYCDCLDGSDEPGTAACPGGTFYCLNKGFIPANIHSQFVNDGICDCCDGSDEYGTGNCTDVCEQLGYEAKREKERLSQLLVEGSRIRIQMIASGKRLLETKQERIGILENEKIEATRLKEEAEALKNEVEARESSALEAHRAKEEAGKALKAEEEKMEEIKEAKNLFTTYDSNNDGRLQVNEVKTRQIFDQNKDGTVSDEEINYLTDLGEDLTFEKFLEAVWPRLKSVLAMDKIAVYYPDGEKPVEDNLKQVNEDDEENGSEAMQNTQTDDSDDEEEGDKEYEGEDGEDSSSDKTDSNDEPKYNEDTRQIIEEANQARAQYDSAVTTVQDLDRELSSLKDFLSKDYGSENEFAPLDGQCFTFTDREYSYKLCPFDQVSQMGKNGGSETKLGTWAGWEGKNYSMMIYDKGQPCWNGPQRSAKVTVTCGLENSVKSASEPNRCEYVLSFETPAACRIEKSKDSHDEL